MVAQPCDLCMCDYACSSFKERYVIVPLLSFVQVDNRGVVHADTLKMQTHPHKQPHTRLLMRGVSAEREMVTRGNVAHSVFVS